MTLRLSKSAGVRAFIAGAILACASSSAGAITFNNLANYNAAVGIHNIIDFTGLADGTIVTNQFAGLGATFTDGNDTVFSSTGFVADGKGIFDNGSATIEFSSFMNHFGVEFPGAVQIDLFNGAMLVSSNQFGSSGEGFFGGLLENAAVFDRVVLSDFVDLRGFYDNLHFGRVPVPEPGTLALLALGLAGLGFARRRKAVLR